MDVKNKIKKVNKYKMCTYLFSLIRRNIGEIYSGEGGKLTQTK